MESFQGELHPVEIRRFKDQREENRHIVYTIREEMGKKTPLSQIAVLTRTNQGPRQLIGALMAYNIPFCMRDAVPNLFDHWIAKNIIDYMRLAMGDRRRSTFLRVMNRPKRYISREYLTEPEVSFDDLDLVIDKLGKMGKNDIIAFMHKEQAYVETSPREVIEFKYAESLQI